MKTLNQLSLATLFVCAAGSIVAFGQQAADVEPLSTKCHTTLTKAGVGGMKICISEHGNFLVFESPLGTNHMVRDGYALATGGYPALPGGTAYDLATDESGWGPPTIVQPKGPNTLPLSISRRWTTGSWQGKTYAIELKQDFAWDTAERDVTITMTLKNVGTATYPFPGGYLGRFFDANIDNKSGTNAYYVTRDSVFAWQPPPESDMYLFGNGLALTNLSIYNAVTGVVPSTWGLSPEETYWDPSPPFEDPVIGNSGGLLTFQFGGIAKGASRSYKIVYRRF